MSDDKKIPIGEEQWIIEDKPQPPPEQVEQQAPRKPQPPPEQVEQQAPRKPEVPASTGDMQEVGATEPTEVPERREEVDGEPPVEENPGDQNSG